MKTCLAKNTSDMVLVAQIFDSGSISAASSVTGLERTSLSRRLKDLESRVGMALFDRSGKRIQVTETGRLYLEYCNRIRELVEEAEQRIHGSKRRTPKVLRILADFEEAGQLLSPLVSSFSALDEGIEVVITLETSPVSAVPEDIDLLVQLSARLRPGIQVHDLGRLSQSVWAAPSLVAGSELCEEPELPDTLPFLGIADPSDGVRHWRLSNGPYGIDFPVLPRFRLPSLTACREACVDGLGAAILPDYLCAEAQSRGELLRIFPNWRPPAIRLTGARQSIGRTPQRVRSFIAFCAQFEPLRTRSSEVPTNAVRSGSALS